MSKRLPQKEWDQKRRSSKIARDEILLLLDNPDLNDEDRKLLQEQLAQHDRAARGEE